MVEVTERPVVPVPPPRKRRRWVRWTVAAAAVVLVAAGVLFWIVTRPPRAISINDAVNHFRTAQPTPNPSATGLPPAPEPGVYVYATSGSEHISVGGFSHTYPAQTALTVTEGVCGLRLRWDALEGRYMQWELCGAADGWHLRSYVDAHKFLYLADVHRYTCNDVLVLPRNRTSGSWTATCAVEGGGTMTITATVIGTEQRLLGGKTVATTRVAVVTHATGKSVNDGTVEAWLIEPTGLPVRVEVRNHGSQEVVGSHVTYDETARFDLTSVTPRR